MTQDLTEHFRDVDLARRAKAESLPAFVEIVRRFEGRLFNFLLRRTRSPHDAEDLTQETFVRAWQRIDQYDPRWQFSTWLFTIGRRLAAEHGRRRGNAPAADLPCDVVDTGPDPAAVCADREQYGLVWDLAERVLSDTQHTVLWLRYAEDLSVGEIARVMHKSRIAVRVTLCRARDKLARNEHLAGRPRRPAHGPEPAAEHAAGLDRNLAGDLA